LAARSENISLIKKFYKKKIILIDRFVDSTIAYQHYGMGVDLNIINIINKFLLKDIKVNFTFLNIVDKKNLIQRLKKRKTLNRYDKFNMNFYNRVQKGYLKLSKLKNKSYQIINSNLNIKKNENLILNKIDKLIK
jgi:dTMP kinase